MAAAVIDDGVDGFQVFDQLGMVRQIAQYHFVIGDAVGFESFEEKQHGTFTADVFVKGLFIDVLAGDGLGAVLGVAGKYFFNGDHDQ